MSEQVRTHAFVALDSSEKDKKTADSSKCSDRIEKGDVTETVGGIWS